MLTLRGAPALSNFRNQSQLSRLQEVLPSIEGGLRRICPFCFGGRQASPWQMQISLIKCSVMALMWPYREVSDNLVLVIPRMGTISPWSSKATDIAHNCGLQQVKRIERGTAFYLSG